MSEYRPVTEMGHKPSQPSLLVINDLIEGVFDLLNLAFCYVLVGKGALNELKYVADFG
jgi:hypothetical protein